MGQGTDKVYEWRFTELTRAGFTVRQSESLAADTRVDLHKAKELVRLHGCPPDIAFDILSGEVAA